MRRSCLAWAALALSVAGAMPAYADPGDKAGWSLATDPRRRAFLIWTPEQNGPRDLMLACLRDAGTFTTMSYAVGADDAVARARLTLSNGTARFEVDGGIERYPRDGSMIFISDLDVNDGQLKALGRRLVPVLEGPSDLTLIIAPAASSDSGSARTRQIPVAGLAAVLGRFREICFR